MEDKKPAHEVQEEAQRDSTVLQREELDKIQGEDKETDKEETK